MNKQVHISHDRIYYVEGNYVATIILHINEHNLTQAFMKVHTNRIDCIVKLKITIFHTLKPQERNKDTEF